MAEAFQVVSITISTHAPLAGRDAFRKGEGVSPFLFQPTRPLRGATCSYCIVSDFRGFQPTRPLRGATIFAMCPLPCACISTHAPLAGRDIAPAEVEKRVAFQPTRPLRGATSDANKILGGAQFQPTRPLRGATTMETAREREEDKFQPTRPLRGATPASCTPSRRAGFQPTRPLRGATVKSPALLAQEAISTHAPLAGRDTVSLPFSTASCHFNPRAPCGARRRGKCPAYLILISTHAPLAGRDSKSVQITMHIFAITDKFQMLLHRMPPVRAFCSFLMQENHADFGCEPPK